MSLSIIRLLALVCVLLVALPLAVPADEALPSFDIDRSDEGILARELRKNRTWPHQDMAYRLQAQGDLAGAIRELRAYLAIDPKDDNVRLQLAILLGRVGDTQAMLSEADHLVQSRPNAILPLFLRARALERLGREAEARADFEHILALPGLNPVQRADAALSLAFLAQKHGEPSRTMEALEAGGQILPPRAEMLRGQALSGLGEHARALDAFELAAIRAESQKDRNTALLAAAEEAIRLDLPDRARALLARATTGSGPDVGMELRLAELSIRSGQPDEAVDHFRRAVDLGDDSARVPLARILFELGRLDEAENEAEIVAETAQTPEAKAEALALVGVVRERRGDRAGAAQAFEKRAETLPGPEASLALARTRAAEGQNEKARQAYEQALAQAPTAENRFELALVQARAKNHRQAVRLLNEALNQGLSPEQTLKAWEQLGYSLAALSRRSEADRAWNQAVALSAPDSRPDLLTALADNAWEAGRHAQAARYFEQAWQAGGRRDPTLAQRAAAAWAKAGQDQAALASYLALATDPNLSSARRRSALESAAHLQRQSGDPATAAKTLVRAADLPGLDAERRTDLLTRATALFLEAGYIPEAQELLGRRLKTAPSGPRQSEILMTMADLEESQARPGWPERALELLTRAETQPHLPPATAARAAESSARILRAQNDLPAAVQALERSVILDGETPGRMLELGYLFATLDENAKSRDAFARSAELGGGDQAFIGLARAYEGLGQPGLALHALEQAPFMTPGGPGPSALSPDDRVATLGLLGYLNEELQRPDQAALWYERALELDCKPLIRFRLARALFALGRVERADELLCGLDRADLPPDEHLSDIMLRARVAKALGRLDKAETVYRQALAEAPSADLWYELGGLLREQGDHEAAAQAFAQASSLRCTPAFLVAEGYELLALDEREKAQPLLTDGVCAEPDYLPVHQDLGYIAMQRGDNDLAVDHFMNAIDNAPLRPVPDEVAARNVAEDVRRMRGEVRALTNQMDLDLWLTYTTGKTGTQQASGLAAPERDVIRTSSGVELGWIPPDWGFQDHRIFKFIGRLTWNMKPDSLDVQDKSWDGALGVRYKPLKDRNLNLGLERIFNLSGQGEDNWVARAMLSLANGTDDVHPHETIWNYSFLFGEVDAYLESPSRLTAYIEGRQGFNWKLDDNLIVSPFLVADAKWWSGSRANDVSFYEGGLGLSGRFLFDETKYELPRRNLELLLAYKIGRIFDADNIKDDEINAFFATIIFRF